MEEEKPIKLEGRPRLCKVSPKEYSKDRSDNVFQFSGLADFDSTPGECFLSLFLLLAIAACLYYFTLMSIEVFHVLISEEEKKVKVKVKGRRRLCKVSHRDGDAADRKLPSDEPKFSELVDFDSPPPPPKDVIEIDESGGKSEIRDILNQLSSRFDLLSIERRKAPKSIQPIEDSPALVRMEETGQDNLVDLLDYASADSSFSSPQISSNASNNTGGGIVNIEDDSDDFVEVSDHFESEQDNSIILSGPKFTYKLPGKIAKMLYPHQREGLKWLWSLHCQGKGGILGDDMGLGKTMQVKK